MIQQRVWKFPINVADESTWDIEVPSGSVFLHAAELEQFTLGGNWISLWVMFPDPVLDIEDTPLPKEPVSLVIYGTGHLIKDDVGHIATVPMRNGLVWHLFIKVDNARIKELIERSSLGTDKAKALRASVSDERAERIVRRAREMEEGK